MSSLALFHQHHSFTYVTIRTQAIVCLVSFGPTCSLWLVVSIPLWHARRMKGGSNSNLCGSEFRYMCVVIDSWQRVSLYVCRGRLVAASFARCVWHDASAIRYMGDIVIAISARKITCTCTPKSPAPAQGGNGGLSAFAYPFAGRHVDSEKR